MMRFLIDIHFVMALGSFRKQPFVIYIYLCMYLSHNLLFY